MDKKTDREVKRVLGRLGMSDNEQCVYLHLLEKGPGVAAVLAKRCHFYRPMIYRAIKKLLMLDLIYKIKKGKRTEYAAHDPKRLRQIVAQLTADLDRVLPALKLLHLK